MPKNASAPGPSTCLPAPKGRDRNAGRLGQARYAFLMTYHDDTPRTYARDRRKLIKESPLADCAHNALAKWGGHPAGEMQTSAEAKA